MHKYTKHVIKCAYMPNMCTLLMISYLFHFYFSDIIVVCAVKISKRAKTFRAPRRNLQNSCKRIKLNLMDPLRVLFFFRYMFIFVSPSNAKKIRTATVKRFLLKFACPVTKGLQTAVIRPQFVETQLCDRILFVQQIKIKA